MRTFAAVTFAGLTGIVLFKLLVTIFFPIIGLVIGLIAMTAKLALIAAVIFFIYSMIKKRKDERANDNEVVVE